MTDIQPLENAPQNVTAELLQELNADIFNKTIAETSVTMTGDPNGDGTNESAILPLPADDDNNPNNPLPMITLNGEGVYTFKIREVPSTNQNDPVVHDSHETTVVVRVEWDDSSKKLVATKAYSGNPGNNPPTDKAIFINSYDASGKTKLEVQKILTNGTIQAGQFTFELVVEDAQSPGGYKVIATATNDAQGNVVFESTSDNKIPELEYVLKQQDKTFVYFIREVIPEGSTEANRKDDIVYDPLRVKVEVTPTDNQDSTMTADPVYYQETETGVFSSNPTEEPKFTNEQLYSLEIKKVLDPASADRGQRFAFKLILTSGDSAYTTEILPTDLYLSTGADLDKINWVKVSDGVYTFTLAHRESIKMYLSADVQYVIEETADGYTTTIQVTYEKITSPQASDDFVLNKTVTDTITIQKGNQTVQYTNIPGVNLPKTGGKGTVPFTAAGLCILGSGIMYAMYLRKKKEREEDLKGSEGF